MDNKYIKNSILKIENLNGKYHKNQDNIINNIEMEIYEGEIVAIFGANGSGKSTLFKAIMNLLYKVEGQVFFNKENIIKKSTNEIVKSGISYLMQDKNYFKNLSVEENFNLACHDKSILKNRKKDLTQIFPTLQTIWNKRAGLLSGGERQIIAITMALANSPKLVLLDEPSAGLDSNNVPKIMNKIKAINKEFGITFLIIEQNINSTLEIVDKVYIMKNGGLEINRDFSNLILEENLEQIFFK